MRNKTKLKQRAELFTALLQNGASLPVPGVYGTKLWPTATTGALQNIVDLKEDGGSFRITLPNQKRAFKVLPEDMWELACMASCTFRSESMLPDEMVHMWESEKPWLTLQAHQLKYCRTSIFPEQLESFKVLAEVANMRGINIPSLSILENGWAWMFEKSPGVWPPAELINPRSCFFDPILGILSFQDIYNYLKQDNYPATMIWYHELSLCLAAQFVSNNHEYALKLGHMITNVMSEKCIRQVIEQISNPIKVYKGAVSLMFKTLESPEAQLCLAILVIGWDLIYASGLPTTIEMSDEAEETSLRELDSFWAALRITKVKD